jgi:hypothetical protein
MIEKNSDTADLGALIETYRPVDKQGCINTAVIALMFYIFTLNLFLALAVIYAVLIAQDLKFGRGLGFGHLAFITAGIMGAASLVLIPHLITTLRANRRKFSVTVYENGFVISNEGKTVRHPWRNVRQIELLRRYREEILWIECNDRTKLSIRNYEVMRLHSCSDLLIKRWRDFHGTPPEKSYPPFVDWLRRLMDL